MSFNNFLQGVATQVVNTGLKKVAGNLPGINLSYNPGNSSDQLPLSPKGNLQHYTFPLDVMSDPGNDLKDEYEVPVIPTFIFFEKGEATKSPNPLWLKRLLRKDRESTSSIF